MANKGEEKLIIGGREIPIYYSAMEMIAIQEEIGCTAYQLKDQVFGLERNEDEDVEQARITVANDPKKLRKLATLIRILGNAGLETNGQEPDLTDKWILRNIKPVMVPRYAVVMMMIIVEGNTMTEPKRDKEDGPVDAILEEEQAKKQQGN